MKEIPTALQHSAPVVWVVLDNASLHWVKWIARATGERYLAVDFDVQPDLVGRAPWRAGRTPSGSRRPRSSTTHSSRARSALRDGRPAVLVCAIDTWDYPRGLHRVPSRRVGPRATRRREYDMSWIETGSTICFKPYTLEQALHGLSEAGFENVEIGAVKGFLEHLDPDQLGPAEIDSDTEAARPVRAAMRVAERARVASPRRGDAASPERPRRAKALRALVLNTFTGDAETPEESRAVQGQRASARRRGAGRRHPAVHRDGLEPPAHRRDRDAAARRDRSRLDPDQLRPRQRRRTTSGPARRTTSRGASAGTGTST